MLKSLYSKALQLLAKKEYSKNELYVKLQKYSCNLDEINVVIDKLEQCQYLSDTRYVELYINSRKNKYGKNRLQYELQRKGIDSAIISDQISNIDTTHQIDTAYHYVIKKYGTCIAPDLRGKIARSLFYRGFGHNIVSQVFHRLSLADD